MWQIRNFRIGLGSNVKCACEAFCVSHNSLRLLEHWDWTKDHRDATLLIVRHTYTQDQRKLHFKHLNFSFSSYAVCWSITIWGVHPTWLLYFEHIFLELVTLNLYPWMKSTSSSSHRLHNKILERLILTNMNTTHDQDSSSWTQRAFRHPSIGSSAQPQLSFSKLST